MENRASVRVRFLLSLLLVLAAVAGARGDAVHVPLEQPSLQAALDATGEGDTIWVAPGRYTGPDNASLYFHGINRVLIGSGGSAATVLDGGAVSDRTAFYFWSGESSASKVMGFTLEYYYNLVGGGVICDNGSSPWLEDLVIRHCAGSSLGGGSGGGLYCRDSSPTLISVVFEDNFAEEGGGGGMGVWGHSSPTLIDVTFRRNSTFGFGGGLRISTDTMPVLQGLVFEDNQADGGGGLAVALPAPFAIDGFVFRGNRAARGGAVYASEETLSFSSTVFADNDAVGDEASGGALYLAGGQHSLSRCTLARNTAQGEGSGIFVTNGASLSIDACIVAMGSGGAGLVWDGSGTQPQVTCSDFFTYEGENYGGSMPEQTGLNGNISANPYFCGDDVSFTLHANSPCLPGGNSCQVLMGALGEGCVATGAPLEPPPSSSFSAIKSLY